MRVIKEVTVSIVLPVAMAVSFSNGNGGKFFPWQQWQGCSLWQWQHMCICGNGGMGTPHGNGGKGASCGNSGWDATMAIVAGAFPLVMVSRVLLRVMERN